MSYETGSLVNHLMGRTAAPTPTIGMGATILGYTDRHAATIVDVSKTGKVVWIRQDKATRIDSNGMSEAQHTHLSSMRTRRSSSTASARTAHGCASVNL